MKDYERGKRYDLAAALPLITFYAWSVWHAVPGFRQNVEILRQGHAEAPLIAAMVAQFSGVIFSALLIVLLLIRSVPVRKTKSLFPRATAVAGTFAVLVFLQLPRAELSFAQSIVSSVLIFSGIFLTVIALLWLGRSFSIMPEARKLVTSGPYAIVRHPIYLFEEIAVVGFAMQFAWPWSPLLLTTHLVLQVIRLHYEERVLMEAFPEYSAYAARTARLIPGIY